MQQWLLCTAGTALCYSKEIFLILPKNSEKVLQKKLHKSDFYIDLCAKKNFSLIIIFIIGRSKSAFSMIMSSLRKQILEIVKEANN